MRAKDIMTTDVATITQTATVVEAARKLLDRGVSALPVVAQHGKVIGIVSEGDLMRRAEVGTEPRHRSWWLELVTGDSSLAKGFVRSHARQVADVMTHPAICVPEELPVSDIAEMLEEEHIKRVPVLRDDKLVGIVSRADLVRALAAGPSSQRKRAAATDSAIREAFLKSVEGEQWYQPSKVNVVVSEGTIHLWGWTEDAAVGNALRVAAENVPGVRAVRSHLGVTPPWIWAY